MSDITNSQRNLARSQGSILSSETVIYLLDCSGSMSDRLRGALSYNLSKMELLKGAMKAILRNRIDAEAKDKSTADLISIIAFPYTDNKYGHYEQAKSIKEPSRAHQDDISKVHNLTPRGGTPMLEALQHAEGTVETASTGLVRLVVVSDGIPQEKEEIIAKVKQLVTDYGATIDSIGIGASMESYYFDDEFMRNIAEAGNGTYTAVNSKDEIEQVLMLTEKERRALLSHGILLLNSGE